MRMFALLAAFASLSIVASIASAQHDDPRFDTPVEMSPAPAGPYTPTSMSVATDENGFDNFFLGIDAAEPHMSTNPLNAKQFFNAFNTNGGYYTLDGNTWTSTSPNFGVGFILRGDPATAYDSLGNLYYENMFGVPSIQGCRVIKSTDNGQTWSAGVTAIAGIDKNWIAADQTMGPYANYVYTTMTSTTGGNFARSTDHGATWTTTFSPTTQTLPGMMVCVGANVLNGNNISGGCVYVVTNSGSSTAATYTFYRSTNGGATFTLMSAQSFAGYVGTFVNGRNSVQTMRTRPYPFITADNSFGPFRGRLYLVYASNNPAGNGNKPDILCRYSTDHGVTWSNPTTVNDDVNSQNNHQWMPAIWSDKQTGRLYVKWFDTRNIPTSDSAEVYASYSDDGGVTFVPNQNLSTQKFKIECTTCGGGGVPRYQGDYDAITSNADISMAAWSDFRNGSFGSYAAYFPDYAMKTSTSFVNMATLDSAEIRIIVPAVKLYTHTVRFTATVSGPSVDPMGERMRVSFPIADSLTSYPDSVVLRIKTVSAFEGNYTVEITGQGPNGTPVHKRTVTISVGQVLPVQLASFSARVTNDNRVQLNWMTVTETYNFGFFVQRRTNGEFTEIPNSFVPGHGTTTEPHDYSFVDGAPPRGNVSYRLKQVDFDGTVRYSEPVHVNLLTEVANQSTTDPITFALEQNYPNPFNPTTTISFRIPNREFVSLHVYDVLGRDVATLVSDVLNEGTHSIQFDASKLPSGVYYYRLQTSSLDQTKRMTLLR